MRWGCPPPGPEAVGGLARLILADSSGSPSTTASTMPRAEGGDKEHMGRVQLFVFLNNPFGVPSSINSRNPGFSLYRLAPVPCSMGFIKPHQAAL